jgi:hypothetical protein
MAGTSQALDLIAQLSSLTAQLASDGDQGARKQALSLSRQLTACLEVPENTAVDLAFSVWIGPYLPTCLHTLGIRAYLKLTKW